MESYERKSDEAESHAERLADEGDRVDKHIKEAKRDWQAKQDDPGTPGAVPEPADEDDTSTETESETERDDPAADAGQ